MSELPDSWITSYLADLLNPLEDGRSIHQGWSPKCEQFPSTSDDNWGVLKTTAIQDGQFLPEHNKQLPAALSPRPHLEVRIGDLLLTCAGPRVRCGVPCLVRSTRPRLMISGKMYRMRVRPSELNAVFVEAMLRAPETQKEIDAMKTGMSESGMNLTHERFSRLEIPLAPYPEQSRIADKLDTVLTRVDACRKRLERVPTILKRFRQSVLAFAASGNLTADWRIESGCTTHWRVGKLEELLEEKPRNGYSPKSVEFETKVKALTLTATTSGRFLPQHFKYINETIPADSHLWLQPNDILIQRANTIEYVGVSVLYDGPPSGFIYPDLMMKVRANKNVLPKFLNYLLLTDGVRSHFRENATGTAGNMPKINQATVLSAPVSWPQIDEQLEIVRRVDSLFAFADNLEAQTMAACKNVGRLTPSILSKAFRGELIPQDPDDEPASDLIKRILSSSASQPNKPKRGRKTGRASTKQKSESKMLNRQLIRSNHLTAILAEKGALTSEALWSASQLDIDDFYDQLKSEEEAGFLKERRDDATGEVRLLEAA